MHTCKRCIIWSHAIILQIGNCVHSGLRHIMLSKYGCQLLGTVIAIVEEDYSIAIFDCPVDSLVYNRLNKLVGDIGVIRLLHGFYHIRALFAHTVYKQVISLLDTLPALVAVHGIIATDNRGNLSGRFGAMGFKFLDKSLSATGVCVTAIHKAVDIYFLQAILLGYVAQSKKMVKRRVYTAI